MAREGSWREQLAVALQAATEAGDYFKSRIDNIAEVKTKSSPSDLVTDVDPECEKRIRTRIAERFPDHAVLGEESTAPGASASAQAAAAVAAAEHLWILDPLDGTTNFVHGLPLSVVSIAYAEHGELCVGAIYDPYRRELFYAVRGEGAYVVSPRAAYHELRDPATVLPGQRLQASDQEDLRRCVVATGVPTRGEERRWTTEAAIRMMGHVKSFRALGAAALHLAYVASGRIDAFWEYELNAWDLAAGVLLVEEAGGVVRDVFGDETYRIETRSVVTGGTAAVVDGLLEAVRVPGTH